VQQQDLKINKILR